MRVLLCVHMCICVRVCQLVFLKGVGGDSVNQQPFTARVTHSGDLIHPQQPQDPSAPSPHPQTDVNPHTAAAAVSRLSWWLREEEG